MWIMCSVEWFQAYQDSGLHESFPEKTLEKFLGHCFHAVKRGTDVLHELGIQRLHIPCHPVCTTIHIIFWLSPLQPHTVSLLHNGSFCWT